MPIEDHVDSLRAKHAHLEQMIEEEQHRPMPDQVLISRLKKEKLRLKEEMEHLRPHLRRSEPMRASA
ncbi:MAG: YdcH family protein [Geminicoccaceae bacterium]